MIFAEDPTGPLPPIGKSPGIAIALPRPAAKPSATM
jgi:hypothetical protein